MKWLFSLFRKPATVKDKPWLVDRDGRVIIPARRVVLRGKSA